MNKGLKKLAYLMTIATAAFIVSLNTFAQSSPYTGKNFVPGNSFAVSDFERINLANGNLFLSFPLAQLPVGRGGLTTGIYLTYNSKLFESEVEYFENSLNPCSPLVNRNNVLEFNELINIRCNRYSKHELVVSDEGGWQLSYGYSIKVEERSSGYVNQNDCYNEFQNVVQPAYNLMSYVYKTYIVFPDGSKHEMIPSGYIDAEADRFYRVHPNGWINSCGVITSESRPVYYSVDGTYLRMQWVTNRWILYFPDGSYYDFGVDEQNPARLYDRNNNYVTFAAGQITDQFGRSIRTGVDGGEQTVTVDGVGGNDVVWRLKWKNITAIKYYKPYIQEVLTNCTATNSCPPNTDPEYIQGAGGQVLDYLKLPSQTGNLQYTFSYNAYDSDEIPNPLVESVGMGELSGIELPSGATISYDYTLDNVSAQTGILYTADALENRVETKTLEYNAEYDGSASNVTEVWTYDGGVTGVPGSVTGPDGSVTTETTIMTGLWGGLSLSTVAPDGTKVEKFWSANKPTSVVPGLNMTNPYVDAEFTFIKTGGSTDYTHVAIKDFNYDKNGNVTEVKEYDWMPLASIGPIPRDGTPINGLPTGISGYLKRITKTAYYNDTPDASSTTYTDEQSYHLTSSPRLLRLPLSVVVQTGDSTPVTKSRVEMAYDHTSYSTNTIGGNLTQTKAWDSTKGSVSDPLTTGTNGNSIVTSATYNSYGMPTVTTDANGVETTITYGCIDGTTGTCSSTAPNNLYPTKTEVASNYSSLKRTSAAKYDFYTGLVTEAKDVDNDLTVKTVYDDLGRPTIVKNAYGTSLESWTQTEYHDENRFVVVKSDLETKEDAKKVAIQHFDQLGRVRLARTLEDASTQEAEDPCISISSTTCDGIKVQTRYKFTSGYTWQLTSNPYRAATSSAETDATMGWTRSKAWASGLQSEVETFSGATLPQPFLSSGYNTNSTGVVNTSRDANATTVTDQAGKLRRSITNGLGQLIRVDEPNSSNQLGTVSSPNQPTYYSYDTLGNMVHVDQGNQDRWFMYSSLGRMLRVKQPEQEVNTNLNTSGNPDNNSWSAGLSYDNNGNVLTTTDAKGTTTTMTYDGLNRVTQRSYNDNPQTPTVNFYYDGNGVSPTPNHAKGKLTKVENGISQTLYTDFDEMGRLLSSEQRTPLDGESISTATARTSSYQYNLSGAMIKETYPSGREVKHEYDASGDIARIFGKPTATATEQTYATGFAYFADGKIGKLKLGNGLWESGKLNSRLQATEIAMGHSVGDGSLMKLNYEYGELQTNGSVDATKNAGNIAKQTVNFSGLANPFIQTYKYDSLDRITEAIEKVNGTQTWKQTFGYDLYGNRTSFYQIVGSTELSMDNVTFPSVDTSSNRFSASQGYSYDKNGNITADPVSSGRTFIFNGDNKQTEVKNSSNATIGRYYYDGNGKRVKKVTDAETTVFVYDGMGKLIAEYSTTTPPSDPTINYTATDTLGSPRVLTDKFGQVVSRRDFMPFGEELYADGTYRKTSDKFSTTGQDAVRQRFTGYQKDTETNLDFAEARYYQNQHGRFTAVDPLLGSGKSANPQTFNRYVYCINSPLAFIDPNGLQVSKPAEKQKVFVFLFTVENEKNSKQMWKEVSRDAKKSPNVDLTVYRGTSASMENYVTALGTEGAIVISTGHNAGGVNKLSDKTVTGNRNVGDGITDANGAALTSRGFEQGGEVYDASSVEVNASKIMINSCNIDNFVPFLTDRMKPGSELIYNDTGAEGLSGMTSNEQAAAAQTRAILSGKDPVSAAQKVIDTPANQASTDKYGNKFNVGDKIVRVVKKEKEE